MMRILCCLLILFIPEFANADPAIFTPSVSDLSVQYLSDIFGVVDSVLHGSGSQIMGTMFGVFNSAMLALGGIIIMYVLMVGTLKTAHEGQALGQKWDSMWIPIRVVMGMGLVAPKATGYCFIQIFIMWVIVQGVGAADTLWNAATNYLLRGGVIIQPSPQLGNNSDIVPVAGNILKMQTCMYGIYNAMLNLAAIPNAGGLGTVYVPSFANTLVVSGNNSNLTPPCYQAPCADGSSKVDTQGVMNLPGHVFLMINGQADTKDFYGQCGSISWTLTDDSGGGISGGSNNQIANPANLGASDSRSIAVQQLVLDTAPLAQQLANIILPPPNSASQDAVSDIFPSYKNFLTGSAADYIGIMMPYLNLHSQHTAQRAIEALKDSQTKGWILAGSYYYYLSKASSTLTNDEEPVKTIFNYGGTGGKLGYGTFTDINYLDRVSGAKDALADETTGLSSYVMDGTQTAASNLVDNYIVDEYLQASTYSGGSSGGNAGNVIKNAHTDELNNLAAIPPLWPIIAPLKNLLSDIENGINGIAANTNADPIVKISQLGTTMLNDIEKIWFGGSVGIFYATLAAAVCSAASPLLGAATTTLIYFVPIFVGIVLALLVIGGIMAYYIPLIPFILFLFTTIGWFIAVIEAMVAAPLVALGIAHPEGHEAFGKAEPAVMLLANVFLRPTLIIIGFVVGIILARVALWLLNQGLVGVVLNGPTIWTADTGKIISVVVIAAIYVGCVLAILNRAFALIHEIPSRVLRWIGGQMETFGEAEAAREVKGSAEGALRGMESGMQQIGKGSGESASAGSRAYSDARRRQDENIKANSGSSIGNEAKEEKKENNP